MRRRHRDRDARSQAKRRRPSLGRQLFSTPRGKRLIEALLRRRVGETPAERLRWLVEEFLRLDLAALTPGELAAKGDDLRMIAVHSLPRGVFLKTSTAPMALEDLQGYRTEIDRGLRAALGRDGRWLLPGRPVLELQASGFRIVTHGEDEAAGILSAVAQLVVEAGSARLRICKDKKCQRPFVANKRQAYCDPKHSQRVRNQTRSEKEKELMARSQRGEA